MTITVNLRKLQSETHHSFLLVLAGDLHVGADVALGAAAGAKVLEAEAVVLEFAALLEHAHRIETAEEAVAAGLVEQVVADDQC